MPHWVSAHFTSWTKKSITKNHLRNRTKTTRPLVSYGKRSNNTRSRIHIIFSLMPEEEKNYFNICQPHVQEM